MTAPAPSPEEFANAILSRSKFVTGREAQRVQIAKDVAARDAALLAPLRAENARLREALRPFVAEAMSRDDIMHDTMNPDYHLECTATVAEVRAAARALAEGQP